MPFGAGHTHLAGFARALRDGGIIAASSPRLQSADGLVVAPGDDGKFQLEVGKVFIEESVLAGSAAGDSGAMRVQHVLHVIVPTFAHCTGAIGGGVREDDASCDGAAVCDQEMDVHG